MFIMRIGNCCSRRPLVGATPSLVRDQRRISQSETATEVEKRNQAAGYDCICV
jgi:hypothetical protein